MVIVFDMTGIDFIFLPLHRYSSILLQSLPNYNFYRHPVNVSMQWSNPQKPLLTCIYSRFKGLFGLA